MDTEQVAVWLPPRVGRRVLEFLASGISGKLTLNVERGRIVSCQLLEVVREPSNIDAVPAK